MRGSNRGMKGGSDRGREGERVEGGSEKRDGGMKKGWVGGK